MALAYRLLVCHLGSFILLSASTTAPSMAESSLIASVSLTTPTASASATSLRQRYTTAPPATAAGDIPVVDCGTHFYDDGTSENALFFQGGGHAGEPDHLFAVMFPLADFNLAPGSIVITGFCAGNRFDFSSIGGPWPNEVFIYPDNNGAPDLNRPLRHTTMFTGDGSGDFIASFDTPVLAFGDFWLVNQGYPPNAGEDFNMETDQSSDPMERSYITDRGLPFLFQTEQNFILRAYLALAPPAQPVPSLGSIAWFTLISLLAISSYRRLQAKQANPNNNAK